MEEEVSVEETGKELPSEEALQRAFLGEDASVEITMPDGSTHSVQGEIWKVQHGDGGGVQIEILVFIDDADVPEL